MSHMNHRRKTVPVRRRRANPNGGESGCSCHPTEGGKPSALGKTRWKRREARELRRVGKQMLMTSKARKPGIASNRKGARSRLKSVQDI